MARKKLTKKVEKKSLNVRVSPELFERLQQLRQAARDQGAMYNVSVAVEDFLRRDIARVEKELDIDRGVGSHDDQPGLPYEE